MTAAASSTLTASEIGDPVGDLHQEVGNLHQEVGEQSPVHIGRGPRITVDTVELMKAEVSV